MTQIVYSDNQGYLCFKHAVHEATKGTVIETEHLPDDYVCLCYICYPNLTEQRASAVRGS